MTRVVCRQGIVAWVVVFAAVGAGCGWTQVNFDAGGTRANPFESTIGRGNVAQLTRSWSVPAPSTDGYRSSLVKGGRVFASRGGGIDAFDERSGAPLWSAPPHASISGGPVVGAVEAIAPRTGGTDLLIVGEWDVGSPLVPKIRGWTTALDAATGSVVWSRTEGAEGGVVVGGTLFQAARRHVGDTTDFDGTIAFDVATGVERFRAPGFWVQAAANGLVYGDVAAGEAAIPVQGCGAARCAPSWTAGYSAPPWQGKVAVANGWLYLASSHGIEVFPATGCGSATCLATWKAAGSYGGIAVTRDRLFVNDDWLHGSGPNVLRVFDASGCGQPLCVPLWESPTSRQYVSPTVANGLVFMSARGDPTDAWSTDGCGAAVCDALWSTTDPLDVTGPTVVADGRLLVLGEGIQTYTIAPGV